MIHILTSSNAWTTWRENLAQDMWNQSLAFRNQIYVRLCVYYVIETCGISCIYLYLNIVKRFCKNKCFVTLCKNKFYL